jgi:ferredoxin
MTLMRMMGRLIRGRVDYSAVLARENALADRPGAVTSDECSPARFEIALRAMELEGVRPPITVRTAPHMIASQRGIDRSLREIDQNPPQPKSEASPDELREAERYAREQGVAAVGYARLPRCLVFRDKAVLFENAIVLVMEMDKDKIEAAPAPRAAEAVHETYHYLGDASNALAGYLRELGFAAHAGHPLNGLALYPPLGQMAGLGWRGRHGMLITPQFGPRMRLAAVFTSIANLPFFSGPNPHRWVERYCQQCGECKRRCPAGAILDDPVQRKNGLFTCTDAAKCFPFFVEHHGCSVCIKVCPFNRLGYDKLKSTVAPAIEPAGAEASALAV